MDDSLKKLESQLEGLVPRSQSESGRERCHELIDELIAGKPSAAERSPIGLSWISGAAAASVALSLGLGAGWYLGKDESTPSVSRINQVEQVIAADFDRLDHETWMLNSESPGVYLSKNGEVRELLQETEVTKEIVKHRESGVIITVETTDHHVIDSVKTDF